MRKQLLGSSFRKDIGIWDISGTPVRKFFLYFHIQSESVPCPLRTEKCIHLEWAAKTTQSSQPDPFFGDVLHGNTLFRCIAFALWCHSQWTHVWFFIIHNNYVHVSRMPRCEAGLKLEACIILLQLRLYCQHTGDQDHYSTECIEFPVLSSLEPEITWYFKKVSLDLA